MGLRHAPELRAGPPARPGELRHGLQPQEGCRSAWDLASESALRGPAQSWRPRSRSGSTRGRELVAPGVRLTPGGMESLVEFTGPPADGACVSAGGVFEQENGRTPAAPAREFGGPWTILTPAEGPRRPGHPHRPARASPAVRRLCTAAQPRAAMAGVGLPGPSSSRGRREGSRGILRTGELGCCRSRATRSPTRWPESGSRCHGRRTAAGPELLKERQLCGPEAIW